MPCRSAFFPVLLLSILSSYQGIAIAHDGPDPLMRWRFDADALKSDGDTLSVEARLGPDAKLSGRGRFVADDEGGSLFLEGGDTHLHITNDHSTLIDGLPQNALTVSAWITVDRPQQWGGLVGVLEDNGSSEFGWILGYNEDVFTFGLAGQDGPGRLTYLAGKTKYELGRFYHLVAVYDGQKMQLYVNGKLDAESNEQSGPIAYPAKTPVSLGAYHDSNECIGHRGRLRQVAIYPLAAKPKWIEHDFGHLAALSNRPAEPIYGTLGFEVQPYLQFGTQDGMTVMWRTNRPATTTVHFGESSKCEKSVSVDGVRELHEVRLDDLGTENQYFYRVESKVAATDESMLSEVFTFQTAVRKDTPFAFAVMSDTQGNPKVSRQLAEFAWEQRPNFLLHAGDLVSTGKNDQHWTEHFFPGMRPLIGYVPFFPVLGNHEQNAQNYFDYVSLPDPEFYYTYKFGNTQFFMLDSNRKVDPQSDQYRWLDEQLGKSTATWKFVCHHHPPFSSDENDYGDLWKTNQSTRGDTRVRQLVNLYERHNVDFVWNGHIHSYERTWALRDGRAVNDDGPIYMITGGGGGSLETPGPIRPFFQNTVRRGHHYAMVRINGSRLEIQAYDIENRLFDTIAISK